MMGDDILNMVYYLFLFQLNFFAIYLSVDIEIEDIDSMGQTVAGNVACVTYASRLSERGVTIDVTHMVAHQNGDGCLFGKIVVDRDIGAVDIGLVIDDSIIASTLSCYGVFVGDTLIQRVIEQALLVGKIAVSFLKARDRFHIVVIGRGDSLEQRIAVTSGIPQVALFYFLFQVVGIKDSCVVESIHVN